MYKDIKKGTLQLKDNLLAFTNNVIRKIKRSKF